MASGDDDRITAGRRIAGALGDAFDEEGAGLLAELGALGDELSRLGGGGEGGLLGAWLRRVARDHSNLVPLFEHADLELLDRVYVQLELRPGDRRLSAGEEEMSFGIAGRQLQVRELLALDPADHLWITRRWVVRGDPGAGKTTLLRHLAATEAADVKRSWVPVFASLPRLMRRGDWLLDRLEREMKKAGEAVSGLSATLDREGREGRLLLLLDGLDEVHRE